MKKCTTDDDGRQVMAIAHMVKLQVFGNNSKTVNNIRNLTRVKMTSTARSNYPAILEKILELLPFFHQNCMVVRSCCAGHFYPGQISDIINSF